MRDLNYAIKQICDRNRDGSFATRANRERMLDLCATQVRELGFRHVDSPDNIKPKHIHRLVESWQKNDIATGTIKNRMACLRWLAEKTAQDGLVAKSNGHYGIEERIYVTNEDRSLAFETAKIESITDRHIQASALLQREFGLRREEAMKIQPKKADKGDKLQLQASWCKGSRERVIPICTAAQRAALNHAFEVAGPGSLIPNGKTYKQQINTFERLMTKAGLSRSHGARHCYAQERYETLTGRPCPARGGLVSKALTPEQKALDRAARLTISQELGHERESITAVYLGR